MRLSGRFVMSFGLVLLTGYMTISAMRWPFRTALFPVLIGSFVFLMAFTDMMLLLLRKGWGEENTSRMDYQLSDSADGTSAGKRTLSILAWLVGFFILVLLLGFHISIPFFFFLFLKFRGKEGWWTSIVLSALVWAAFYWLFVRLLHIPFFEGFLLRFWP